MPLVRQPVPNLIGGVSQQSAAVRPNDQCTDQINCWPSPKDGLTKRQPSQHIAKLVAGLTGTARNHFINRDTAEQYLMQFSTTDVKIYTLLPIGTKIAGDSLTVTGTFTYLANSLSKTARDSLRAYTIADYTFLLNNTKTTAMDTAVTSTGTNSGSGLREAFVFVRQGNYGTKYRVRVAGTNGVTTFDNTVEARTYTGPGGGGGPPTGTGALLNTIKTDDIALELQLQLQNLGIFVGTGSVTLKGSVIRIVCAGNFSAVETMDSVGDSTLSVVWKTVPRVTNYLPEICVNGYIVKVVGDAEIAQDDYYVKFFTKETGTVFGRGEWQEDLGYGQEYQFLASTMPHVLIRTFNGSGDPQFAWQPATWLPKLVGDTVTNPRPSFIGKAISNISFYKERLLFLADDKIVLSETQSRDGGSIFNFWRVTNLVLEDTSPIDVTNNYTPVAISKSATPYNQNVILKSARSQFVLRGAEILSPRTVQVTPVSQFESFADLDPIAAGRSLFFGFKRGDYSGLREFFEINSENAQFDSTDITLNIPNYIYGDISWFAISTLEETLVCQTIPNNLLYVYKYIWQGNQKVLSSWGKWEFNSTATVRHFTFIENVLYLLIEYPDGMYLEKVNVATGLVDTGQTFITHLDRRVDQTKVTSMSYDPYGNFTVFTLPYTIHASHIPQVVQKVTGRRYQVTAYSTTQVYVLGDITAANFFVGLKYIGFYLFTKPVLKIPEGRGINPVPDSKQMAQQLWVEYNSSGAFHIDVQIGNGTVYATEIAGPEADWQSLDVDTVTLKTGSAYVPINGRPTEVACLIVMESPYPVNISSAVWDLMISSPYRSVS